MLERQGERVKDTGRVCERDRECVKETESV